MPHEPGETHVGNGVRHKVVTQLLRHRDHPVRFDDFLPQLWCSNHTATRKIPETISAFDQSHYGRVIAPNVSFSSNVLTETTVRLRASILCVAILAMAVVVAVTGNAATSNAPPATVLHPVRATGVIRAVHSVTVLVPFIEGQGGNLALATLAENGALVNTGDSLATFDRANELKLLRDAQTKFEDLARQIEEKKAEHLSNAEKRIADLQQAEADLKKAEIESRKGPVLSAIDQEKNQVKLTDAREHAESLRKSSHSHDLAEEAELRVLQLQHDRAEVAVQRQTRNSEKLLVKAPLKGMVALQNIWHNNTMGHAQEGDELWPGSPLLKLFDPSLMDVEVSVGEPDGAVLVSGAKAIVHLDAFPDIKFTAHYTSASPVATAPLGMSVKNFTARFRLDQSDPHLLPDLSAAVDIQVGIEVSR
jgi:HlyD family secretion protein